MKNMSFTRLGGKTKGGRPIVKKYSIGQSQGPVQSNFFFFLKLLLFVGLCLWLYWLHVNGLVVFFNRALISDKTLFAIDLNIVQSESEHYVFSLANGLLMGVYLSALLPFSGKRKWILSFIMVWIVVLFAILSLGYVGIFVYLNFDFLNEKLYISNGREGLVFFVSNLTWFILLYAVSLLIEAETD